MKKKVAYGLIAIAAAAIIIALGWGAAWIAGTTEGARWLLDEISRRTPLAISARTIEGRLLDRLQLGDVRLALAPFEVKIGHLDYRWQPLHLLSGRIAVKELTLTQVEIRDRRPIAPSDLAWPVIPAIAGLFDGRIDRLGVNGLTYRLRDGAPVHATAVSSSLAWQGGVLSFNDLAAVSVDGRVTGKIAAGFDRPSLRLDLAAIPARAVAGMDEFSLHGLFHPGRGPEQLAGEFTIAGASGRKKILALAGEAGMTRKEFLLRKLRLIRPGRRGELTGAGSVTPTIGAPILSFALSAAGIDLAPEIQETTDISGTLTLTGTPDAYQGEFRAANRGKGWRATHLAGSYSGDGKGLRFAALTGGLLAGSVQGSLDLAWGREVSLSGSVRARNLNPQAIDSAWAGVVNFDLAGRVAWDGQDPPRGELNGRFLESRLHGQALTGEIRAGFAGGELNIGRLLLKGKGFDIHAAGNLARRLDFTARVGDLGGLIPGTGGEFSAEGWVRRSEGRMEGAATGRGAKLAAGGVRIAAVNLTARLGEGKGYPVHVAATLRGAVYDLFQVDSATIDADGTVLDHKIHAFLHATGAEMSIGLSGGVDRGGWQGRIVRLSGRDAVGPWNIESPAKLSVAVGRITLAPLVLTGEAGERIEVAGEMIQEPTARSIRALWNGLNLIRANPWLPPELRLEGRLSGRAAGEILPGGRMDLKGSASLARGKIRWRNQGGAIDADLRTAELAWGWQGPLRASAGEKGAGRLAATGRIDGSGTLTVDGRPIAVEKASVNLDAGDRGLKAAIDLSLAGGGEAQGNFFSSNAVLPALPETGEVNAQWSGIDMALLRPWLPGDVVLEGRLGGRATGNLLAGRSLALRGDAALSAGNLRRLRPEGRMNVALRLATVAWEWQGDALRGHVALALAEQGEARGSFRLPIPARLPAAFDRKGPLAATLTGQIRENGLLGSLFPGLGGESRGDIDGELRIGGTGEEPAIEGTLKLTGAGAYLPTAGIRIRDVKLAVRLEKDLIRIDSFRAESGPGHLEGTALVRLKGWQVADYGGTLNGERFQVVYLPELQILASPRLTFEGTPKKLAVRGEVNLPEMLILGPPAREVVSASRDVIIEGAAKHAEKTFSLALDVRVRLVLGKKVLAKLAGIDAQLGGGIDLEFQSLDQIASRGEIRVEKGRYRAYGADLDIVRGRLFYAGGPVGRPTLDLLALRTIGDVKAGVTAGGGLRAPVIKLYSEPSMPDADILSYILFGHPMSNSSNREQAGMMAQAAGVLLSKGQSAVLREQIKNRLGLSTLEIQSDSVDAAGRMGYKEIPATPAGVAPASQTNGVSQTMVTVGKYLTPQLYFSYGRSLFTGGNLFRLRYDLFKQWQIETQTGSESGVDLYYRIDFK